MAKTKPEIKSRSTKDTSGEPSKFSKFFPYIGAFVVFLAVTLIFFSPMLLDDKKLDQGDVNTYAGASKEVQDFRDKTHTEPLWTNSMFGGMPAFQISTYFNGNLTQPVEKALGLYLPEYSGYLFIAALGFYILMLVLGIDGWLSIAGGIAYSLATYNLIIIEAGHNSKMHAISLLPYVVAGFFLLWRKKYLLGAAVSMLAFSMLISANHVQIAYYLFITLLIAGIVFLVYSVRDGDIKHYIMAFGIFAACGVMGVASNLSLLWTTYEYGNSTIRGKSDLTSNTQSKGGLDRDYAFQWSYGKMEAFNLLIPNFTGGSDRQVLDEDAKTVQATGGRYRELPTYWGDQPFTSGPMYLGALMLFLFVLGLIVVDGPMKWWLGIVTPIAIMLAMGHNLSWFNNFVFDHFPGYNKFRTVTMSMIICQLTVPMLGILALYKIMNKEVTKERALNGLYIAAGITGGICLIFLVLGGSLLSFSSPADQQFQAEIASALKADRRSLLTGDSLRSLILILIGAGVVWAVIQEKLSRNIATAIIVLACLFDYMGVGKRFINDDQISGVRPKWVSVSESKSNFNPSPADQAIAQDQSLDYRVFNTTVNSFNDASTSYHHKSVGGYHAAKLRRYQELIENHISKGNMAVLNMLNTKYFIQKGANGPVAAQNPGACGNAWFVSKVVQVANADQEMDTLKNFDPKQTAYVDVKFADLLKGYEAGDTASTIRLTTYEPNHLVYEYNSSKNQTAVFSEIYYQPGWVATVDGKETPIARVDYVLRAMPLPAGSHKVEMKFHPGSYYTGETVSMASSLLILLLFAGALFMEFKHKKEGETLA